MPRGNTSGPRSDPLPLDRVPALARAAILSYYYRLRLPGKGDRLRLVGRGRGTAHDTLIMHGHGGARRTDQAQAQRRTNQHLHYERDCLRSSSQHRSVHEQGCS